MWQAHVAWMAYSNQSPLQRIEEYNSKRDKAVETALGDKIKDMVYIDNLITLHKYRGQGYASALVRLATSLVST